MPRPNRRRHSGGGFNEPLTPQKRSRLIEREVPTHRSSMEGMSVNFAQFFNMASQGIAEVQAAEHAKDMADIEQQNLRERWEAASLALQGKELTPEQKQDMDYEEVWTKTTGANLGAELGEEFAIFMSQQGSDVDPEAARQEFLQQNLKNGEMFGTGNDLMDVSILAQFKKMSDPIVREHRLNSVRVQLERGRLEKSADIANNIMDTQPGDVVQHMNEMAALLPGNENEAPGYVVAALMSGVQGDQDKAAHVNWLLKESGTGIGEQSFAESFPEAFEKMDNALTQDYLSGISYEGVQMLEDVEDFYNEHKDYPEAINALIQEKGVLDKIIDSYGMKNRVEAVRKKMITRLEELAESEATFNQMAGMARRTVGLDESLVKKHQAEFFERIGLDPFSEPEAAAEWIVGWSGSIDASLQQEFSAALTDNDPQRFASAIRFGLAVEDAMGEKMALAMFNEAGDNAYLYAKRQALLGRPINEIHQQFLEGRADLATAADMSWTKITGLPSNEAFTNVADHVDSVIEDEFGDVVLDETVKQDILSIAKTNHVVRNRGQVDWDKTIEDTVKSIAAHGRLSITPGPNGTKLLTRTLMPPEVNATTPDGLPMVSDDGTPVTRKVVPISESEPNPHNAGIPENTYETWQRDASTFVAAMPNLQGVDEDSIHLDGRSQWSLQGGWLVKREGGLPITLQAGQKFTVNGKVETIPEDFDEALEFLQNLEFKPPAAPDGEQALLDSAPSVNRGLQRQARSSAIARNDARYNDDATARFRIVPADPTGEIADFYILYVPGFRNKSNLPTPEEVEEQVSQDRKEELLQQPGKLKSKSPIKRRLFPAPNQEEE